MAKKRKEQESQQIENVPLENVQDVQTETSTNNQTADAANGVKKVETIKLKVTQTVTALETMEDVKLVKIIDFENVTTPEEALQRLGNDSAKLLEVINRGLQADAKDAAKTDDSNWRTLDEKGNPNGPFSGEMVDPDKVGGLIREMSKIGGYTDNKGNPEKRRQIREKATQMVKAMIQGNEELKKSVALTFESDVVADVPESTETTV